MAYTRLNEQDKVIKSPSGVFPSGEGMFFDELAHSVNSIYQKGLEGGLNNANATRNNGPNIDPLSSGLIIGSKNLIDNSVDLEKYNLLKPSGLDRNNREEEKNNANENLSFLSNAIDHSPASKYNFELVNSYIHYSPNPLGGTGEIDQTSFYYSYDPSTDSNTPQFFRYGKP